MKIIGFYKDLLLVEKDGMYIVVDKTTKKILFNGDEENCSKYFIMKVAKFIDEGDL